MKKKVLSTLLAVAMTATMLAGCGKSATTAATQDTPAAATTAESQPAETQAAETTTGEAVTLKLFSNLPDRNNGQGLVEQMIIDEYMKANPNVTIEVEALDEEAYKTKFKAYAMDGMPDVVSIWGQPSFLDEVLDAGVLAELNEADYNSNPLEDIKNTRDIEMVWKQGKEVYSQSSSVTISLPDYEFSENDSTTYLDELHKLDGKAATKTYTLMHQEDTIKATLDCYYEETLSSQESFECEKNLITKKWDYYNATTGNKLQGTASQDKVTLAGEFNKKQVNRSYDMNGKLWMQMGEWNLSTFALSGESEIHYYSIGTGNNRGALEMTEFTSKNEGEENISINGVKYSCVKISTVLTKYPFIWTGYNMYEKKTGKLITSMTKGNKEDKMEIK